MKIHSNVVVYSGQKSASQSSGARVEAVTELKNEQEQAGRKDQFLFDAHVLRLRAKKETLNSGVGEQLPYAKQRAITGYQQTEQLLLDQEIESFFKVDISI